MSMTPSHICPAVPSATVEQESLSFQESLLILLSFIVNRRTALCP